MRPGAGQARFVRSVRAGNCLSSRPDSCWINPRYMKPPVPRSSRALLRTLVSLWVALFILGTIGHLRLGNPPADSLFKSLQLFHLHYHPFPGHVANPEAGEAAAARYASAAAPQHPGLAIEVARFGAALFGLAILPVMLGFFFERRRTRPCACWRCCPI